MNASNLNQRVREYFTYRNKQLNEISFPLGGIGSGSIALAGNGRLIDWEIFNRPNKGSVNGFSHFAIKSESDGHIIDARILQGDLPGPLSGSLSPSNSTQPWKENPRRTFGFGPERATLGGLPHFKEVEFMGTFPIANLIFQDPHFPGITNLTAYNPFIPGNSADSSIPAACFELQITNTEETEIDYTVALVVTNPSLPTKSRNHAYCTDGNQLLTLATNHIPDNHANFGDITIGTDCDDLSYQEYWFRGMFFDDLTIYWYDFNQLGHFQNRSYPDVDKNIDDSVRKQDTGVLASRISVPPSEKRNIRFVITWNYPNCINYWRPGETEDEHQQDKSKTSQTVEWRNYYATRFSNSTASAVYCLNEWGRLKQQTEVFRNTLYASSVPLALLDAAAATLSVLKSPTVLRLEDGTFYGFEGVGIDEGCCEGSCSHVWNYAYALPFLFPDLERSMRDADFRYNTGTDGGMTFRLQLPLGRNRINFRPCADGQFGGIIKAYREWKISGDSTWLRRHWATIKTNLAYAWSRTNPDQWDRDRDGVLEGRQHHTLDMELFGPNSWLTGFYLAALSAGSEIADYFGEADTAKEYRRLFKMGKNWVNENLFNGEYYHQQIDLKDSNILSIYQSADHDETHHARSKTLNYWDSEHDEIKYQVADGCGIDQVLAQWHANLCGIQNIFDREKTRSALSAIYRYNFKRSFREHFNPSRLYGLEDECGTIICSFPRRQPIVPVPYAQESMHGFEYQAAAHMIQEGMLREGMEIVQAVRDRYDGSRRNPWNEIECGSNYARSMAAFSLLLAWSGFEFDAVKGHIGFSPKVKNHPYIAFWSLGSGWGTCVLDRTKIQLKIEQGDLPLSRFKSDRLNPSNNISIVEIYVGRRKISFEHIGTIVNFRDDVVVSPSEQLTILLQSH